MDNWSDADLMQVVDPLPLSTGGVRYPQPVCGACYYTAGMPSTFRFSGVAGAQVILDRVRVTGGLRLSWVLMAAVVAVTVAVRDETA